MYLKAVLTTLLTMLVVAASAVSAEAATQTFTQETPTSLAPSGTGKGDPYPSTLPVSGVDGQVTKVTAAFEDFSHQESRFMNFLLVGPGGQNVVLLSDVGGPTRA